MAPLTEHPPAYPNTPSSQDAASGTPEPFPTLDASPPEAQQSRTQSHDQNRDRAISSSSTIQSRLRSASRKFEESNLPPGFMIATSQVASSVPSIADIRRGSYNSDGWTGEGQIRERERRASLSRKGSQTSEELARHRTSSDPHSPKHQTGSQERRNNSEPEVVSQGTSLHLGVINSGVPLGASGSPKHSMEKPRSKVETDHIQDRDQKSEQQSSTTNGKDAPSKGDRDNSYQTEPFDNGYQFPPKQKWTTSTAIGLAAFWKFFITPSGFLITIYGLNVVAWGGMLFLLLCNAAPAMCRPTCDDINSPRRIWIEIDSQILNALFCVTGFGLIPWRFRDLYYLLQYRIQKKEIGLRRLAGINRGWFRLAGSQDLPVKIGPDDIDTVGAAVPESVIPFPVSKTPNAPLTGNRAPPTKMWKLDFVIWTMVWNTFLQAALSGFMWGMNRYNRPSWSTGLFVALAMIVAAAGGIMSFVEGKHVKAIEGVPVTEKEKEILRRDRELGITHYNNIKDEAPKEKKKKRGIFKRKNTKDVSGGNEERPAVER